MKEYKIEIKNLIALSQIIDDYEKFDEKIKELMKTNNQINDIWFKLLKLINNQALLGNRKIKKFYNDTKDILDVIGKYTSTYDFLSEYSTGKSKKLDYYYKYLKVNMNKLDDILVLLNKLQELGFSRVTLNENLDLDKTYSIYTMLSYNIDISYLDNMEVIPTYDLGQVKYKSNKSDYIINAHVLMSQNISIYGSSIEVSNLLFDPNRLPPTIDKENIFEYILNLRDKNKIKQIRNAVDLNVNTIDLNDNIGKLRETVERIEDNKSKDKLINLLYQFAHDMNNMNEIAEDYNKNVAQQLSLDEDQLEEESKKYIKRRNDTIL